MLGKWDLMANFLGVAVELSGGTILFRPQPCAESGNLLQKYALGVKRLAKGFSLNLGFWAGETLPFQEMPDSTVEGELGVVCRQTCSGKMYGVGAGS
jgi:hypothetical protein